MLITRSTPEAWQELEEAVELILRRSGLQAERGRVVTTVRGQVAVDVLASQPVGRRAFTIACECKHWKTRVNQNVVHGFRTVMNDMGADRGYIISTVGFQSGAHEAAHSSNIRLRSWEEFQEDFEEDYFQEYVRSKLNECLDCLFSYCEPISPMKFLATGKLAEHKVDEFLQLKAQYADITLTCLPFFEGMPDRTGRQRLELPLRKYVTPGSDLRYPEELLDIDAWDQFLDILCEVGETGCRKFRELVAR
ncbi:MAG: hypothetical protein AMS25_09090 [Gemmatimonas sp. SM23_52]|nr:MAG: hypothetical protein AMS25_09090 [Gemmatimonas sp. SM23_52]